MKIVLQTIQVVMISFIVVGGVVFVQAQTSDNTWDGPPANPPGGNAPAPINVSVKDQTKLGSIESETSLVAPSVSVNGIITDEICIGSDDNCIQELPSAGSGSGVPTGGVMEFADDTCPSGWSEMIEVTPQYGGIVCVKAS